MNRLTFKYAGADVPSSASVLCLVLAVHALAAWWLASRQQALPESREQTLIVSLVAPVTPVPAKVTAPQVDPPAVREAGKKPEPAPEPHDRMVRPDEQLATQAQEYVPASPPAPSIQSLPEAVAVNKALDEPLPPAADPVPAESAAGQTAEPEPFEQPRFNAEYLNNPSPGYPPTSRRLREEGTVQLRVRVDVAGQVLDVQLRNSSGHSRLDERARETVMRWKFIPARQGGQPVEAWVIVPIQFSLKG